MSIGTLKDYILGTDITEDDIVSSVPLTQGNNVEDVLSLNLKRFSFNGETNDQGFKAGWLRKISAGPTYPYAVSVSVWEKNRDLPGDAVFIANTSGFLVYYDNGYYLDVYVAIKTYEKHPITDAHYVRQNPRYRRKIAYQGVIQFR